MAVILTQVQDCHNHIKCALFMLNTWNHEGLHCGDKLLKVVVVEGRKVVVVVEGRKVVAVVEGRKVVAVVEGRKVVVEGRWWWWKGGRWW